jgi:hypothetical protein
MNSSHSRDWGGGAVLNNTEGNKCWKFRENCRLATVLFSTDADIGVHAGTLAHTYRIANIILKST